MMDGISRRTSVRVGGLIMFFTANCGTEIYAAVLRSARVDIAIEFSRADEFQARACYAFY